MIKKIDIQEEMLVISKIPDKSYSNVKRLVVGREDINEIRAYLTFDKNIVKDNINKIELVMFLKDIDLKGCNDKFMLNIGIVTEDISNNICWSLAPAFFQESIIYKIGEDYKSRYIKFDITYLYNKHYKKIKNKFTLVLIGLNSNATLEFATKNTDKKGYLSIIECEDERNQEYRYTKNREEEYKQTQNDAIEKSYCEVYTVENKVVAKNNVRSIIFEKLGIYNLININKDKTAIIVNKPGIYSIQYTVNCISDGVSTMMITINDEIVESSIMQVGNSEGNIVGHCIVKLEKGNEKIRLNIEGDRTILINRGISAKLNIVEI